MESILSFLVYALIVFLVGQFLASFLSDKLPNSISQYSKMISYGLSIVLVYKMRDFVSTALVTPLVGLFA